MRIILFSFTVMALCAFAFHPTKSMNIHDAVEANIIALDANSTGQMNGTSVRLKIELLKGLPRKIAIPAGTVFITDDPNDQNMLVAEPQEILVKNGTQFYPVRGYCCQSSNSVPSAESGFEMAVHDDKDLMQMLAFTQNKPFSTHVMQEAIWAVCNGESPYTVSEPGNQMVAQLREKICAINGTEVPVYEQRRNLRVVNRRPVAEPVLVRANVSYEVKKKGKYLTMIVEDADGNEVSKQKANSPINYTGTFQINFKLKVQGWEAGEYVLKLKLDDELVKSMPFMV